MFKSIKTDVVQLYRLPKRVGDIEVVVHPQTGAPTLILAESRGGGAGGSGGSGRANDDLLLILPDEHAEPGPRLAKAFSSLFSARRAQYEGGLAFLLQDED